MTIGPILILLAAPLLFALITLVVQRRWPLAAAVTGGIAALFLATQTNVGAADPALHLFGRTFSLTAEVAVPLRLLYLAAALLFLLSARWPQGREFVPAGLAALAPLAATVMAQEFPVAVVALLAAAAFLVIMIQAGRHDATLASLRYLTMTVLALPFFLVAAWMLGSDQPAFTGSVWRLLLVGAILVLAGFPFHIWVRPVVDAAPPLATVFIFTLAPAAIFILLINLLQQYPIVVQETPFPAILRWSAAAAALAGGLLALNAPTLKSLWGCLLLFETGSAIMLVAAGPAGDMQPPAALAALGLRFAGLLFSAVGLLLLDRPPTDGAGRADRPTRWQWLGWALFTYGALSLVGLPLTPGFPARWAAVSAAATASPWLVLLLLTALAAAAAGLLRRLSSATPETAGDPPPVTAP